MNCIDIDDEFVIHKYRDAKEKYALAWPPALKHDQGFLNVLLIQWSNFLFSVRPKFKYNHVKIQVFFLNFGDFAWDTYNF